MVVGVRGVWGKEMVVGVRGVWELVPIRHHDIFGYLI